MPDNDKIKKYDERLQKLENETKKLREERKIYLKKIKSEESKKERKLDTRKKIILGGDLLAYLKSHFPERYNDFINIKNDDDRELKQEISKLLNAFIYDLKNH